MGNIKRILTSKKFLKDRIEVLELKNKKNQEAVVRKLTLLGIQSLALSTTTFSSIYSQNNKVLFVSLAVLNAIFCIGEIHDISKLSNTINDNNDSIGFLKDEIAGYDKAIEDIVLSSESSSDDNEIDVLSLSEHKVRV